MTRPLKRRHIKHAAVAAQLRRHPGMWHEVGEFPGTESASGAARRIRTGYMAPMYQPAGAFEARTEPTEFGTRVVARYVGGVVAREASASGGPAVCAPLRDCDRVTGQIERGEVLAGPEGARRIAARHMEAYGNAVWGGDA
jgi:hypothetical protein